jgi:acylphosphatase
MPTETLAKRFLVSGRVQGVGFRYFAERVALRLGVTGYVKNLADGRVEVYALGAPAQLDALRGELRRGPIPARVDRVVEDDAEPLAEYSDSFTIETEY